MKKLLFVLLITLNAGYVLAAPVPIDNTVPPCDSSPVGNKPPCDIDAGSIKTAPKMPDATDGAIITPDAPIKGLPDRTQQPGSDIID
ncbi:MAG: hypothetical protein ACAH10_08440, partial [Methylophilaceae bacterium]